MDPKLIQVSEFSEPGYRPLVDYGAWRVAVLNGLDELLPENIPWFQRHDETDEVFVLLRGRCVLFAVSGSPGPAGPIDPEKVEALDMEPLRLYNVRRGVFHSHALSPDASLVIVENRDTCDANSPTVKTDAALRRRTDELARGLWA